MGVYFIVMLHRLYICCMHSFVFQILHNKNTLFFWIKKIPALLK